MTDIQHKKSSVVLMLSHMSQSALIHVAKKGGLEETGAEKWRREDKQQQASG